MNPYGGSFGEKKPVIQNSQVYRIGFMRQSCIFERAVIYIYSEALGGVYDRPHALIPLSYLFQRPVIYEYSSALGGVRNRPHLAVLYTYILVVISTYILGLAEAYQIGLMRQ